MSQRLRFVFVGLCLAAVSCSAVEFDVEGDPDAFWASCRADGRVQGGPHLVENAADLAALSDVTYVSSDLEITGLTVGDLAPLSQLRCVRGILNIHNNPGLRSLDGLGSLIAVQDHLQLAGNDALVRIDALSGLRFVRPFSRSPGRGVAIGQNPALSSLVGLEGLTRIRGYVHIDQNDALIDLRGLDNLDTVEDELVISSNPALVGVDGLDLLTTVSRLLVVRGNDSLSSLRLPTLATIGGDAAPGTIFQQGLIVEENTALERVELSSVVVTQDVLIQDNPALASVEMASLRSIETETTAGGDLFIRGPVLGSVELSALEQVIGDFEIDARSLTAPSLVSIGGLLQLGEDYGFEPAETSSIETLDLSSLSEVGDRMAIHNTALRDLSGLRSLAHVERVLDVRGNGSLTRLRDLSQLTFVNSLVVATNTMLPTCEAMALEQQLMDAGFTGSVRIDENDDAGLCP